MKSEKDLVSLICPCYNSADYVQRMLDSVMKQTYTNIELICVDDGSADSTADIIKDNMGAFERAGMKLICLEKEHGGQAAAVNKALKVIKGEFFSLIDSDDFFLPKAIEKRVNVLKRHPECGIVVSDYYIVNEEDINKIIGRGNEGLGWLSFQKRQFELLITGLSLVANTGYMIRTMDMRRINPSMEINECIEGQNYQILLPMYYHYERVYIDEPLAVYVIRHDSHDHMERSQQEKIQRGVNLLKMLRDILEDMEIRNDEIKRYLKLSIFNRLIENV